MTEESRAFPARPIVGVGAVIIADGRVLLVVRGQPPLQGQWSLPGGAVEVGETLVAALQREVLEETGLVVSVGEVVEVLDRIHMDADGRVEYHYVLIDYVCGVVGGRLDAQTDAADARWVALDALGPYCLQPVTRAVIDRAVALVQSPAEPPAGSPS